MNSTLIWVLKNMGKCVMLASCVPLLTLCLRAKQAAQARLGLSREVMTQQPCKAAICQASTGQGQAHERQSDEEELRLRKLTLLILHSPFFLSSHLRDLTSSLVLPEPQTLSANCRKPQKALFTLQCQALEAVAACAVLGWDLELSLPASWWRIYKHPILTKCLFALSLPASSPPHPT